MSLHIDFETRSEVDLISAGAYKYAAHASTQVLLCTYQFDDGPLRRWTRNNPTCPDDIREHVLAGGKIVAHNAAFERLLWWHVLTPKHNWPKPALEQFECTAVMAAAMSLPRSLGPLGVALGLNVQKDKAGGALIRIHSVPVKVENGVAAWHKQVDDPASLACFHAYCDKDVLTEVAAYKRLVSLSTYEQEVYILNERVNDRGLLIDVKSAKAAIRLAESSKKALDKELTRVTNGFVTAVTQVGRLTEWVQSQGVPVKVLDADTIDELLHEYEDIPEHVRTALELRQEGAKSSVSKISAMLDRAGEDGRVRGVYLHHGAGQTGRFSSRGAQMHNMPRPRKIFEEDRSCKGKRTQPRPDVLFRAIRSSNAQVLEYLYGPKLGRPLHLLSDCVRSFIRAEPGYDFIDADYSSIEGRMAAWFAGEEWKLDAFRALDRGEGHGIYELAAAGIYDIPVQEVTKGQRATGKVAELSCQYQTGVGGIKKFARTSKIKLPSLYDALWSAASEAQQEYCEKRFESRVTANDPNTTELGREGWIAAELIKVGWRGKHPGIVSAWSELEEAATQAVLNPGAVYSAVRVSYVVKNQVLWCRLPSGRCLAYGLPKIEEVEAPWADKTVEVSKREKKKGLTVKGVDSQTERWVRFPVYGGSLFNNIVQGAARDILVHGMLNAESAGYPIVLHTHDEMAAEVPEGTGDVAEFERLICELPDWAKEIPLTASGWRGKRYKKD